MPNILTGPIQGSAPTNTLVGSSSAQAVAANNNRQGLILVNLSTSTVYLGFSGNAAVLNSGMAISPNGSAWTMDEFTFSKEAINAIAHSAGNIVSIQEFTT